MLKSILRDQQDLRSIQKEVKKDKLCNIIIIKYDYAAVMTE